MARARTVHECSACGARHATWAGRCHTCDEWGTVAEIAPPRPGPSGVVASAAVAEPIDADGSVRAEARPTGLAAWDELLGGGLVRGSVTLVGGEPGIGKSTLLLQVLAHVAASGRRALLVTAEESVDQVRARAARLSALHPDLSVIATTHLDDVVGAIARTEPELVVVDSVQTVTTPDTTGAPGSVTQVRDVAHRLVAVAKADGPAVVLVGHVTKDGALAGPRVLEHLVDTVLSFDGDRHHALRLLRAVKHRFGATGDAAVFEMTGDGLVAVPDPSALLLADRRAGVAGSVLAPALVEGRPVVVEVQALAVRTTLPQPRRSVSGLDSGRAGLVLAVLERWGGITVSGSDCWVSATGGLRVVEPGVDLAMAVAVASSVLGDPVPSHVAVCAEIGLGGELRQVGHGQRRLEEAARAGVRRVVVAPTSPAGPPGVELVRADTLADALAAVGLAPSRREQAVRS